MIRNVGLIIETYHEEDESKARAYLESLGLSCFTTPEAAEDSAHTFVFTDDRHVADQMKEKGIGFAVYDNEKSRSASFPDALYVIGRIEDLPLYQIERMLLRFLKLPWMITETERCLIREICREDVDALYEIYSDADAFRYTESLYEDREKEYAYTEDYITHQYRFYEYGIWIVTDKETGKVIGRAGLENREGYEDAELGYAFDPAYRHRGYAFEVCSAILTYAKDVLDMTDLNAFTIRENTDSVRLLERLGFSFAEEASLNGVPHDRYTIRLQMPD